MTVANSSRLSIATGAPNPSALPSEPLDPALLDETELAKLLSDTSFTLRNERQDLEKAVKDIGRRLKSERGKHLRSLQPLIESWGAIENEHWSLSRHARSNAIACASSLEVFETVFVIMENSFMDSAQKKQTLDAFMMILHKQQQEAEHICYRFDKLADDVQDFAGKISRSVFSTLWRWVKRTCSFILGLITGSIKCYWHALSFSVSHTAQAVDRIRRLFTALGNGTRPKDTELYREAKEQIVPHETDKAGDIAKSLTENAQQVKNSLTRYERAWSMVTDVCQKLETKAECASVIAANQEQFASIFRAIKCLFNAFLSFLRGYDGGGDHQDSKDSGTAYPAKDS